MDAVFQALGNPSRRRILDILKDDAGCNVNKVCMHFKTSRIAVMKHLRILENADLVHSEKHGRDRRLYFNAVPIQMIYDRWTTEYSALWAGRLTEIKYRIESKPGKKRKKKGSKHGQY